MLRSMADARNGGPGVLHVYHPLGFPGAGKDLAYIDGAIAAGAQVLELGIPFSDPVADGPVVQEATRQALADGATPTSGLRTVAQVRRRHPDVGLVVMAYANSLHRMGWAAAATELAKAGVDGLIVPDMPLREARQVQPILARPGVPWIPLASSTVPEATLREANALAPPFLYAASLGITGRDGPGAEAGEAVRRIRRVAPETPIAVGFGVRDATDVRLLRAAGAHGVVVGSALVRRVLDGATPAQHGAFVAELSKACAGPAAGPALAPRRTA